MRHLLVLLALLFSLPLFCEDIVTEVEIKGAANDDFLKAKLETQPGNIFSYSALSNDIRRLHNLKIFSMIDGQVKKEKSGLKVTFLVSQNQLRGEVEIYGNNNVLREDILKEISIDNEFYFVKHILPLDKMKLKEFYLKKGFLFVEVTANEKPGNGWTDVEFIIEEGPEVYVSEMNFFGNKEFTKNQLVKLIKTQETGVISSNVYDENVFTEDLILVKNFYRSEGYLDARVELRDFYFSENRDSMIINISVDEGILYKVNSVDFVGNHLFGKHGNDELLVRLKLKVGAAFKQGEMLQDKSRIERLYGENGFMNVKVNPRFTLPDLNSNKIDITYEIKEGSETYIRRIDFQGNYLTKDRVIRDNITILPGERINLGKVEESQGKISRLSFFDSIKMDLPATEDEDWKDILIKVEEGRTGNLRFAAGITSDIGVVGEVSITKRNFDITKLPRSFDEFFSGESLTGAGQTFSINFQGGSDILRYNINFTEPRLWGYNIIFGLNMFSNERVRESFDEERLGGRITFGRNLDIDTSLQFSYRLENVDINNLDANAPQDVVDVEGNNVLSSIIIEYTINTQDDFILPARGYIFGVEYELAGTVFGGDHDFSKLNFRLAWFQTLYTNPDGFKHILSMGSRIGFAVSHLDSDRVPIFERFFAGGASSIRGFEFRTVGPIDVISEDPLGGELLFVNTIEYSIPIFQDTFRMVFFSDFGNVAPEIDDVDVLFDEFRLSVGIGFRIKVPVLGPRPFALDFGFPILSEDDDDKQIFSFSFGKPF